jgi:thiol-disulfide isomerase/thioredoxin
MAVLATGVVLSVALGLVNLALTFTAIRWMLRRGQQPGPRGEPDFLLSQRLQPGAKVPTLSVTTVADESRSIADMATTPSLIGFFSPVCPPCRTQLPLFVDLAKTIPGGASRVLAVVVGDRQRHGDVISEFVGELEGAAAVAVEPPGSPAAAALSVKGYPTFYLLEEGEVRASSMMVSRLAARQMTRG